MRDYVDLAATTPYDEPCAQVGTDGYAAKAKREAVVFIRQLRRKFGDEPGTALLYIKSNPHDFGTYYTVACRFDSEDEAAAEYAFSVEDNVPANWDEEALMELQPLPA